MAKFDPRGRKIKILATLGPASRSPEMIEKLLLAGADAFRVNMSHGDHETHAQTIAAIRTHQTAVLQRLDTLLDERAGTLQWQRQIAVGSALFGLGLLLFLLLSFYRSFVIDFRDVLTVMKQTAAGNLQARVKIRGNDELSDLARLLEGMTRNLSSMVAEVRSNSALVAHAGKSLALGNRDLADRTEQQAANLEETAASVQQLSSTVHQNAETASDSDSQAARVRDQLTRLKDLAFGAHGSDNIPSPD